MSEEEIKAIEKFKTLNIKHFNLETIYENDLLSYYDGILILNLIEKQQDELSKKDKKIEELEAVNKIQEYRIQVIDTRELSKKDKEIKGLNLENQALFESINCNDDNMICRRYEKMKTKLSKKDKVIQETIKYLETYPYVAYTLNGDILHNSENAIKILKGEEIDEHLEGDIW